MLMILPQKSTPSSLAYPQIENTELDPMEKTAKNKLETKPKWKTLLRSVSRILRISTFFRTNNEKWIKKNFF